MNGKTLSLLAAATLSVSLPDRPAAAAEPAVHAVLINGGGSVEDNFSSHLGHLRQMLGLLSRAAIPPDHVTVFNADGADPAPDMTVREPEPEGFSLLAGTRLGDRLAVDGLAQRSSTLPAGVAALPATRASIEHWFAGARGRLHSGDTLLLYVTDHGSQNARDPLDNRIVLWKRDALSVRQLRAMIDRLDPGVRVVALMSQCYSGGFAHLMDGARGGPPSGAACGYFSSTADRPAYGCYPEVADRDRVGHSFEFMEALARSGRFAVAHTDVLASDDTPDVPLRTSDVFLADLVAREARRTHALPDRLTDDLLRQAWKDRARWEPEIRLLDRIGRAFGLTSPRSLAEVQATRPRLEELLDKLEKHREQWSDARVRASETLQRHFFAAHPQWASRVTPEALRRLSKPGRRALALELGAALRAEGVGGRPPQNHDPQAAPKDDPRDDKWFARLQTLSARSAAADAAAYRMEVRLAVLLRMRAVLAGVAGRVFLAGRAAAPESTSYQALRRCEDLTLTFPRATSPAAPTASGDRSAAFPTLDDDRRVVSEVLPSWMGISFDDRARGRRAHREFGEGAALVVGVLPDSPAQAAGLAVGDVVLGPPGQPFAEPQEIKIWTMLLPIGRPQPIDVDRAGKRLVITLVPRGWPVEMPELGPPRPASPAPPITGATYRGTSPAALLDKGPFLLFFWATWCGPCKESLPEVLAFSRQHNLPILAVTDESRAELDSFFARWKAPFPGNVVSDEDRLSFLAYGVSGTPTFVLVDGAHKVEVYTVGYSRARGLAFPGWKWDGK